MARLAKCGGMADHVGRDHVRIVGRPRGDRAPGANQLETLTRMNFKAFNTTKQLL